MPTNDQFETESALTLDLLRAVYSNESLTQRSVARDLGVALGLVNSYLRRCVTKGFVKVKHAPSSRYGYYLTPKGFAEKSRLTAKFLSQSLSLFRQAQTEYRDLLQRCVDNGWTKIAIVGCSDLAEILTLYARDYPIEVVGTVDVKSDKLQFLEMTVSNSVPAVGDVDACIVAEMKNPQQAYDKLTTELAFERVLVPDLLDVRRHVKPDDADEEVEII